MKFFLTFNILLFIPVCFTDFSGFVSGQNVSELIPAKTRELTIPFEVRPDRSADPVKEVELLYSSDRGVHWHSSDRKTLEAEKFGFKTETDGEYWFAFRTITLSGVVKQSSTNTPIRVLIDATPPKLSVEIKQLDSGEVFVVWKAEDQYFQMKRPDFAISTSVSPNTNSEKNWTPLNIDVRNIRVTDSGLEGSFRFLPENSVSQLELRASIRDFVGNRVEKTCLLTIEPVLQEKIPQPHTPAATAISANTATPKTEPIPLLTPTPSIYNSSTPIPVTPPKPVRIRQQTKNNSNNSEKKQSLQKSGAANQQTIENIQEHIQEAKESDTNKNDTDKTNLPIPILVSPDGKVAGISEQIMEHQSVFSNRSDRMTQELLANMGAFFDGGLPVEVTKTVPQTPVTVNSTNSVTIQPDIPQSVVRQSDIPQTEPKVLVAGSITGISLNNTSAQPQIIVKWNIGDAPWQESQIDILRGSSEQGPWQPIAINLRNNGEYWWFLTSLDLNPFFIMVRIRSLHSGTASDITQSPININPTLLKQGSLR